jgi:hypothetical protein
MPYPKYAEIKLGWSQSRLEVDDRDDSEHESFNLPRGLHTLAVITEQTRINTLPWQSLTRQTFTSRGLLQVLGKPITLFYQYCCIRFRR